MCSSGTMNSYILAFLQFSVHQIREQLSNIHRVLFLFLSECGMEDQGPRTMDRPEAATVHHTTDAESAASTPVHKSYDIGLYTDTHCSDADKVYIVEHSWMPPHNFTWPTSTHIEKGKEKIRRLTSHCIEKHPWLAYSASKAGVFCRFCLLFGKTSVGAVGLSAGALVTKPLTKYKNMTDGKNTGFLDVHGSRNYHQNAIEAAAKFVDAMKDRQKDISMQLDLQAVKDEAETRNRLKPIVELIAVCGRQGIALGGHRDTGRISEEKGGSNEGNFRALLRYRAGGDTNLRHHLEKSAGNALYLSPSIQNEIINCIGTMMTNKVADDVIASDGGPCFSILADETTDITAREQLSICIRHVTDDGNIREDFVGFCDVHDETFDVSFSDVAEGQILEPKVTGRLLGQTITTAIEKLGLDVASCVGQGFDGAAMMSSCLKGAATVLLERNPMALYIHCCSHSLNLALIAASKLLPVRNMYGSVQSVVDFLNRSAKRRAVFQAAVSFKCPETSKQRLKSLCATRWVERHEALETSIELFPAIVLTLQQISGWSDATSASKADPLLKAATAPTFMISLFATADIMAITRPLAVQLQDKQQDLA